MTRSTTRRTTNSRYDDDGAPGRPGAPFDVVRWGRMSRWAVLVLITLAHALGALAVLSAAWTRPGHGDQADRPHARRPRGRAGAAAAGARGRLARRAGGGRRARPRVGGADADRVSLARRYPRRVRDGVAAARRAARVPAPARRDRRLPLGARALGRSVLGARASDHLRARDVRALARGGRPDAGARTGGRHGRPARVGRDQRPVLRRAPGPPGRRSRR